MTVNQQQRQVRYFRACSDSDLPTYVGSYAEVDCGGTKRMYKGLGTTWHPTARTEQDLEELEFTLVSECSRNALEDWDAPSVAALDAMLARQDHQVEIARRITRDAHAGQLDKIGEPYVEHPRRVAGRLQDPVEQTVAWLHDVLEDTVWTVDDLAAAGIEEEVLDAVQLLTRRPHISHDEYYARIKGSPVARAVKLADIADNLGPARRSRLDSELRWIFGLKYAEALEALGAPVRDALRIELEKREIR